MCIVQDGGAGFLYTSQVLRLLPCNRFTRSSRQLLSESRTTAPDRYDQTSARSGYGCSSMRSGSICAPNPGATLAIARIYIYSCIYLSVSLFVLLFVYLPVYLSIYICTYVSRLSWQHIKCYCIFPAPCINPDVETETCSNQQQYGAELEHGARCT